jgi:hypothetical protein
MKGIGPVVIALAGAIFGLSLEAIFLSTSIRMSVERSISSQEVEILRAINKLEMVKIGLPYALEYSFQQAVYDVSKNGGYFFVQPRIPTYNGLPIWRNYTNIIEPNYTDEIKKATLSYLNKYMSSTGFVSSFQYTEASIGDYTPVGSRDFVCCSPCKCGGCRFIISRGTWEECYCSSECENAGEVCRSDKPGAAPVACKPKNGVWRENTCNSGENLYSLTYCDSTASSVEEACKKKCSQEGMDFLSYTSNSCSCIKITIMPNVFLISASSPQDITIESQLYKASIESNTSQVVKTNVFNILATAESKFIASDAVKDKLITALSSYDCSSDNETVKSAVASAISALEFSNENISLSLTPKKIVIKPDCNSTVAVAVEVAIKDKLPYLVYDGTTAYRNPQLQFYVITSNDYSFQPI